MVDLTGNESMFLENADYISSLSECSTKRVHRICPLCKKVVNVSFGNVNRVGHTYCFGCKYAFNRYGDMLGKQFNFLVVKSFAQPRFIGSTRKTFLVVVCRCGKEFELPAQHIKSGHTKSCGCWNLEKITGPNNVNWNPALTEEERRGAREKGIGAWAKTVKERDGWFCQVCGSAENLVAHHLNSYKDNKENRFDLENGVTLCRDCHTDFHCNFMGSYKTPCTPEDFEQYLLQV